MLPSGRQFEITHGSQKATIVEVGGGIREYSVDGRDVLDPYPAGAICDGAHGTPLVPWPNRLDAGRYEFDGERFQLPLTEPEQGNAIHGFLRWVVWRGEPDGESKVTMSASLPARPGYPFALSVAIAYELGVDGLAVTTRIRNVGDRAAPVGHGQHPYLSPGEGTIDGAELSHPGRTRILTDDRQLPAGREPVEGTEFDFSRPRKIGAAEIDFAFMDLVRDERGRAWTRLTGEDGATASIWVDETYPFVELYTGHTLAPGRARSGLGTEPMSCAPDAFNNGDGLIRLEPGQSTRSRWGAVLEG